MVAKEARTGRVIRLWQEEMFRLAETPFPVGTDTLFVAYYASAEIGCFLALEWPVPLRILDLYAEFRCLTSGLSTLCDKSLLGALTYYGLDGIATAEKSEMRDLAIRGGPFTPNERDALLEYCQSDVEALARLLPVMEPHIDLSRALLRGRYMAAAAAIEWNGVPLDTDCLAELRKHWPLIKDQLIERLDPNHEIYEGRVFKMDRFAAWLARRGIAWPRLESGRLDLGDDTFREKARSHPDVAPIRELRYSLSQLHLSDLAVGSDGRNRTLLSAFQSKTGRNQPSNSRFIFGPSCWLRGLIRPKAGYGLAYIDWCQQEFGIAAALSHDGRMMDAYSSGDPYLAFAKQADAVPPDATKQSHGSTRDLFKACVLAVQYGMGEQALGIRINQPTAKARELLCLHRETYRAFWQWSDRAVDYAMLTGHLHTAFGWHVHVAQNANPRSLRNFPMQANGAEMLRLACCTATEGRIRVCAPVHDALLIEAPLCELDSAIATTQRCMEEASQVVLDGFALRSDVKVVQHPERYMDGRGVEMWDSIQGILADITTGEVGQPAAD